MIRLSVLLFFTACGACAPAPVELPEDFDPTFQFFAAPQ
ncbi:MAG: DNA polymerase III subunit chi [Pseudomonadota bacterium]